MGTFLVECTLSNFVDRSRSFQVAEAMVDTGSRYTWAPRAFMEEIGVAREKKDVAFTMANRETVARSVGFAIVAAEGTFPVDEVVFAEPGDLVLLGARSLEGLNLMVDPARKRLVAAGPLPAAGSTTA